MTMELTVRALPNSNGMWVTCHLWSRSKKNRITSACFRRTQEVILFLSPSLKFKLWLLLSIFKRGRIWLAQSLSTSNQVSMTLSVQEPPRKWWKTIVRRLGLRRQNDKWLKPKESLHWEDLVWLFRVTLRRSHWPCSRESGVSSVKRHRRLLFRTSRIWWQITLSSLSPKRDSKPAHNRILKITMT